MKNEMEPPKHTPWGPAQETKKIAPGIYFMTTASHGGFWIAPNLLTQVPQKYRKCAFSPKNGPWFEEDCSWCGVVLAFTQYFDAETIASAEQTYKAWYEKS